MDVLCDSCPCGMSRMMDPCFIPQWALLLLLLATCEASQCKWELHYFQDSLEILAW